MINKLKSLLGFSKVERLDSSSTYPKKVIVERVQKTDGWMNLLTGLGIKGRDKTASTTFRACPYFTWIELDDLYRADGLTRRIIDIVANEMMRQGWELEGDEKDLIAGQLDELNAYAKITALIAYARLYGGALLVMGIADGRPLDEPVDEENINNIAWLHLFDRYQCQVDITCYCQDLNDPNYGMPDFYTITDNLTTNIFTVHHSRVLRMDWSLLTTRQRNINQGWGDSAIVSIYDELKNYGAAFANTSAIMQDFVNGILKIPGLSQSMASACGEEQLMKRLDIANLSKGVTGMFVLDGSEDYQKLSTNVSGLEGLIDRFMLSVSSVTGIPASLLFGKAPAGLNATGESDVRNFYDMVKQLQEFKLKPVLEKLVKYLMLAKDGPFIGVEPENWNVKFVPLWQNTEEQEALVRKITAETDAIYLDRNVLDPSEVAISRFGGDRWSMHTNIDISARENGYDPDEVAQLEAEKVAQVALETPDPTIGPDALGDNTRTIIYSDEE